MGLPESMVEWRRKWCLVYLVVVVPLYKYFGTASEVTRRTCWRPGDESGKGSRRCFLFTISSSSKSSEALPFLKQKAQSSKVAALPFLHKKDIFTRRELRKNWTLHSINVSFEISPLKRSLGGVVVSIPDWKSRRPGFKSRSRQQFF